VGEIQKINNLKKRKKNPKIKINDKKDEIIRIKRKKTKIKRNMEEQ